MCDRKDDGNITAAYVMKRYWKLCNVLPKRAMEVTPACEGPGDGNWKGLDTGFAQVTGELEVK